MQLFKLKIDSVQYFPTKNSKNLVVTQKIENNTLTDIADTYLKSEGLRCIKDSIKISSVENIIYIEGIAVDIDSNITSTIIFS